MKMCQEVKTAQNMRLVRYKMGSLLYDSMFCFSVRQSDCTGLRLEVFEDGEWTAVPVCLGVMK